MASIYIFKNINCQIIFENEIDNKHYISKGPTHIANVQVQPEIAKWLVQPGWAYVDGLPMLFQMRWYWPKSIGRSIGKYRTEYRELNLLFLNHNFSILPDTCIGPYRAVSGRIAVSGHIGYEYGTHFEVSVIHRSSVSKILYVVPEFDWSRRRQHTSCLRRVNSNKLHISCFCRILVIIGGLRASLWVISSLPACFASLKFSTSFILINLTICYFLL